MKTTVTLNADECRLIDKTRNEGESRSAWVHQAVAMYAKKRSKTKK